MSVLSEDRVCPVCELPIREAGTASYLDYAGMSMLFHDACLESLDDTLMELRERTTPQPASQPMQKAETKQAVSSEAEETAKQKQAAREVVVWLAEQIRQERHTN